ncbi:hypothetical protein ACLOJK_018472 [Asimina triloba]
MGLSESEKAPNDVGSRRQHAASSSSLETRVARAMEMILRATSSCSNRSDDSNWFVGFSAHNGGSPAPGKTAEEMDFYPPAMTARGSPFYYHFWMRLK